MDMAKWWTEILEWNLFNKITIMLAFLALFTGGGGYFYYQSVGNSIVLSQPCVGGRGGDGGYAAVLIPAELIADNAECQVVVGGGGKNGNVGESSYFICPAKDGGVIKVEAAGGSPGGAGCVNNY